MNIQEWIEKLEEEDMPIERFYAILVHARHTIDERLATADYDGVDLDDIEPYEGD